MTSKRSLLTVSRPSDAFWSLESLGDLVVEVFTPSFPGSSMRSFYSALQSVLGFVSVPSAVLRGQPWGGRGQWVGPQTHAMTAQLSADRSGAGGQEAAPLPMTEHGDSGTRKGLEREEHTPKEQGTSTQCDGEARPDGWSSQGDTP